jgi:hypothetical protein
MRVAYYADLSKQIEPQKDEKNNKACSHTQTEYKHEANKTCHGWRKEGKVKEYECGMRF